MEATTPTRKLVFVGDPTVGKSTLLHSYRQGQYSDNNQGEQPLPVLDGFTMTVLVNEVEEVCLLWDTLGSSDFERLRPLSYPKTDCFVVCFAINDRSSFNHVETLWIPELMSHAPQVPFIIVCTKTDLGKREESHGDGDTTNDNDVLTPEEIRSYVSTTQALGYVECSSKENLKGVEEILKTSVQAILAHQDKLLKESKNSQSTCRIL